MTDFVSDNPYRILGVRSDTLQVELKLQAAEYDSGLRLGRGAEFDLGGTGSESESKAATIVGPIVDLMDRDPALKTAYRLLWPMAYSSTAADRDVVIDFDQLEVEAAALPQYYAAQLHFLKSWDQFHELPTGTVLSEVFTQYRVFSEDPAVLDLLTGLLLKEGVGYGDADSAVRVARNRIVDSLLSVSVNIALASWNAGNAPDALCIMEAITTSSLPAEAVTKAVQTLATIGRNEEIALTVMSAQSVDLLIKNPKAPLQGLYLWRIANLLKGRLPDADRWVATYYKSAETIVTSAIHASTDIAFLANEPQVAITLLESLASQPLPPDLVERVTSYLPEFRNNVTKGPTHGGEFKPIKRPPLMWIINGAGTRVGDEKPCSERPGWSWVTGYYVLFFISVFPVRRYLVKTVSKGRWYFYASAPLEPRVQKSRKVGCGVALAAIIGFAVLISLIPSVSTGSSSTGDTATNNPSSDYQTFSVPIQDADHARELVREHDQLQRELEVVSDPLQQATEKLTRRKEALDQARAKINPRDISALRANEAKMVALEPEADKLEHDANEYNMKLDRLKLIQKQIDALKAKP